MAEIEAKEVVNVEDENEEGNYMKKKRKKTSEVWREFSVVTLKDGTEKVECNHCKFKLPKHKDGTTTQYKRHLEGCIKRRMSLRGQANISIALKDSKLQCTQVQTWKYEQSKIREIVSHMIMVHELPFSFTEHELFNLLMRTASPHYQRISRAMAKADCVTSYEVEKKRLHKLLSTVNTISITTDMWKSGQKIQYMVVTGHFVDTNFELQKRVLNFVDVPSPHTGAVVYDALYQCLQEWAIESKVSTITVDNASYNDLAVRMLQDRLEFHKKLPLDGQLFHVRCCAHILNLLVHDGLNEICYIIESVRESVKYISASTHRLTIFNDITKQLHLPNKRLILDCCTRWNATYAMLSCALEFKQVFPRYAERDPNYKHLPSEEDWSRVEEVCTFLELFNEVTKIISGSQYPTANLFLPELWGIKELLDEKCQSEILWMRVMAKNMQLKFDKYWGHCNLLISLAAILDPRNKMQLINFTFRAMYSAIEAPIQIKKVRDSLYEMFNEYVQAHTTSAASNALQDNSIGRNHAKSSGYGKRKAITGREKYQHYIKNIDTVQQEKSELDTYLEEGIYICDESSNEFDALEWWKANHLKFQILSKMAAEILSIPVTTVASESTFSAGGRVIDAYRSSLGADTVQMLLCGSDWYRNFYDLNRKTKAKEVVKEIPLA